MKQKFRIKSIEAENLRSYQNTHLFLNEMTILVGENNEGKSSLLKMFDKLINDKSIINSKNNILSAEELSFWYPANSENHRARRFVVNLEILDGNFGRKYKVQKGNILQLRFSVRSSDGEFRLNYGPPKRAEKHDLKANELLGEIHKNTNLIFLPPVRDAGSSQFSEKVTNLVREKVKAKISHSSQAGAPKEYRLALDIIDKFKQIIEMNSERLAADKKSPLNGMMLANEVRINLRPADVGKLLDNALHLYVTTGGHDAKMVIPSEAGNGLQSLIDIDLSIGAISKKRKNAIGETIVIVEEPEAFLHPSAQRQFMHYLRNTLTAGVNKAVLTTHSPIIVDESLYGEVVLVRHQKHYHPSIADGSRAEINSSLMSVSSSEVFFSKSVVFVEGDGDKALLNTLIKRISSATGYYSALGSIVIQPVGGCRFFAPWLKLVDSYSTGHGVPIKSLWLMDADAASASTDCALIVAHEHSGRNLKTDFRDRINAFGILDWLKETRSVASMVNFNSGILPLNGVLFSSDLEWAIFNEANADAISSTKRAMADCKLDNNGDSIDLARRLGSKINSGTVSNNAKKAPHIRASIAQNLPLDSLPPEIEYLLRRIFEISISDKSIVTDIFTKLKK